MMSRILVVLSFVAAFMPSLRAEDGFSVERFGNPSLSGLPVRVDVVPTVDEAYGAGGPTGLGVDNFSSRWTARLVPPESGTYTFIATADDGVRVWVGGSLVVDDWSEHPAREASGSIALNAGEPVDLKIEHFENGGDALLRLEWTTPTAPRAPIPSTRVSPGPRPSVDTGFSATYYADAALTRPVLRRIDAAIDFDWGFAAPAAEVPADGFGARWIGYWTPRYSEPTTLITRTDDGVRLYVDGRLVIDRWVSQGATELTCTIDAVAGRRYLVEMEYMDVTSQACAQLAWSSASEPRTSRSSQLTPFPGLAALAPSSSAVSPAYLEGICDDSRAVHVLADGAAVAVHALADRRFFADVPLSPDADVAVAIASGGAQQSLAIAWTPTLLSGDQQIAVRCGDALLLRAAVAGLWRIENSSGIEKPEEAIADGATVPWRFASPGHYGVIATDADGAVVGRLTVTAIRVTMPARIAAEVGYARPVTAVVEPTGAPVVFAPNASALLELGAPTASGDGVVVPTRPLQRGSPRLLARIGGADGPVVAAREIDEFTLESSALSTVVLFRDQGDATATFVMRPYLPDIWFDFQVFAHRTTFAGGARSMTLSTSGAGPDGAPFMVATRDEATGEDVGRAGIRLEMPPDESMYCFWWKGSQINSPRVEITTQKTVNGCACKIQAGGGLFIVPEANDEPNIEAAAASTPEQASDLMQGEELWIPQLRSMPVRDGDCPEGKYRFTLGVQPTCDSAGGRSPADANAGRGTTSPACIAPTGAVGPCAENDMRFLAQCALTWPLGACQTCSDTCFEVPVHVGILTQQNAITLIDCVGGGSSTVPKFFEVVRIDADGYAPIDGSGDDPSTRNPIRRIRDSLFNAFGPKDKYVAGVPIQITRTGETDQSIAIRATTRDGAHVRLSDRPALTVPKGITAAQIKELLPNGCVAATIPGGGCTASVIVYAYSIAERTTSGPVIIEVQANEERTRCAGKAIVEVDEDQEWIIADTERVSVAYVSYPPEAKSEFVDGGDSYLHGVDRFIPPGGVQKFKGKATDKDIVDGQVVDDTFLKYRAFEWKANIGTLVEEDDVSEVVTWTAPEVADQMILKFGVRDDGLYYKDFRDYYHIDTERVIVYELTGLEVKNYLEAQKPSVEYRAGMGVTIEIKENGLQRPTINYAMLDESGAVVGEKSPDTSKRSQHFPIPKPGRYRFRVTNTGRPEETFTSEPYVFFGVSIVTEGVTFIWEPDGFSIAGLEEARAKGFEVNKMADHCNNAAQAAVAVHAGYKDGFVAVKEKTDAFVDAKSSELGALTAAQETDIARRASGQVTLATANAALAASEASELAAREAYLAARQVGDPRAIHLWDVMLRAQIRAGLNRLWRDTVAEALARVETRIAQRAIAMIDLMQVIDNARSFRQVFARAATFPKMRKFMEAVKVAGEFGNVIGLIGVGFDVAQMIESAGIIDDALDAWDRTKEQQELYNALIMKLKAGRKPGHQKATLTVQSVPGDLPFRFAESRAVWDSFDPKFSDYRANHLCLLNGSYVLWDGDHKTDSNGNKTFTLHALGNIGHENIRLDRGTTTAVPLVSGTLTKKAALEIAAEAMAQEHARAKLAHGFAKAGLALLSIVVNALGIFAAFVGIGAAVLVVGNLVVIGLNYVVDWVYEWETSSDLKTSIDDQYPLP